MSTQLSMFKAGTGLTVMVNELDLGDTVEHVWEVNDSYDVVLVSGKVTFNGEAMEPVGFLNTVPNEHASIVCTEGDAKLLFVISTTNLVQDVLGPNATGFAWKQNFSGALMSRRRTLIDPGVIDNDSVRRLAQQALNLQQEGGRRSAQLEGAL